MEGGEAAEGVMREKRRPTARRGEVRNLREEQAEEALLVMALGNPTARSVRQAERSDDCR